MRFEKEVNCYSCFKKDGIMSPLIRHPDRAVRICLNCRQESPYGVPYHEYGKDLTQEVHMLIDEKEEI